eukprot:TRINITY_DN7_c0_g1_i1.p1 TRINITY_DN7_c0_g1~~TRINITY_DN7_c0_g1_i1.p1  ORF type:complete len:331 (-),score=67.02 TRINITY_DN7_c0_g1_i1:171-1163(-)
MCIRDRVSTQSTGAGFRIILSLMSHAKIVPRIKLCPSGPEVSQIVIGNWFWNEIPKDQQLALVKKCLELGVTTFDTADIYGGYTSEEFLGDILEPLMKHDPSLRSRIQIITKTTIIIPAKKNSGKLHHYDTSKEHILSSVTQSLLNIRTQYLDVLLLHRPDALMDADEVAEAFNELHAAGVVRYFGVSNYTNTQFALLQSRLQFPLVTNQIELSVLHLDPLYDGTLDYCQQLRIVPMIYSPVRGLFDTDKKDARRDRVLKELKAIGEELGGFTEDQIAIAWVLNHPTKPVPVLGTSKPERVEKTVEIVGHKLSREQWWRIWTASKGEEVP